MAVQFVTAGQRLTAGVLNDLVLPGVTTFSAMSNGAQSVPTRAAENVADAVIWDPPAIDDFGAWSSGATTRWTCPKAGRWTFSGSVAFSASSGGTLREALWFQNGVIITSARAVAMASSAISATALTAEARSLTLPLNLSDYIELIPFHNAGAALTLAQGSLQPFMTATYAGPLLI